MDGFGIIAAICALILAVLVARAIWVVKSEQSAPRGTAPGDGETEIISEYASGVGGGERRTYTIPKDPQEYAKAFVPRDKRTNDQ